jgi:predicted regulator of Ras-like GTPase activity (Roadblock/LC7/MglB family)
MKAVLQDLLDRIPELLGAAVVGLDGIPVEKLAARPSFNIDLASAEWVSLVKRAAAALRTATPPGGPEEISVTSRSGLAILRSIGGDYFLCVVVGPKCLQGRVRYEVWRAGLKLAEALA